MHKIGIDKNLMEKCTFSTFTHVHQICFRINFCVCSITWHVESALVSRSFTWQIDSALVSRLPNMLTLSLHWSSALLPGMLTLLGSTCLLPSGLTLHWPTALLPGKLTLHWSVALLPGKLTLRWFAQSPLPLLGLFC